MTTSVSELVAQREAVERRIRELQTAEKANAIAGVRSLMSEHGLTVSDLVAKATAGRRSDAGGGVSKVAPKYRHPETGSTWSGRGLKPKWLTAALAQGRTIEEFVIALHKSVP